MSVPEFTAFEQKMLDGLLNGLNSQPDPEVKETLLISYNRILAKKQAWEAYLAQQQQQQQPQVADVEATPNSEIVDNKKFGYDPVPVAPSTQQYSSRLSTSPTPVSTLLPDDELPAHVPNNQVPDSGKYEKAPAVAAILNDVDDATADVLARQDAALRAQQQQQQQAPSEESDGTLSNSTDTSLAPPDSHAKLTASPSRATRRGLMRTAHTRANLDKQVSSINDDPFRRASAPAVHTPDTSTRQHQRNQHTLSTTAIIVISSHSQFSSGKSNDQTPSDKPASYQHHPASAHYPSHQQETPSDSIRLNQSDIIANDYRHRKDLTEMEADAETERNLVAAVRNCQREGKDASELQRELAAVQKHRSRTVLEAVKVGAALSPVSDTQHDPQSHAYKLSRVGVGAHCGYCRRMIFGVLRQQGHRCQKCDDVVHSKCLHKIDYVCTGDKTESKRTNRGINFKSLRIPTTASSGRKSPRSPRSPRIEPKMTKSDDDKHVNDTTADTNFILLLRAGKLEAMLNTYSKSEIQEQLRLESGTDGDLPLIIAMRALASHPTPSALAMFSHLLRMCDRKHLETPDKSGWTPLLWALALSTDTQVPLEQLMAHPDLPIPTDALCHLAHHYRLPNNVASLADTMLEHGADINARSGANENTALHYAVANQSIGMLLVRTLIERGADPTVVNKAGESVVFSTIYFSRPSILRYLVQECLVNTNITNNDGNSPLDVLRAAGGTMKVDKELEQLLVDDVDEEQYATLNPQDVLLDDSDSDDELFSAALMDLKTIASSRKSSPATSQRDAKPARMERVSARRTPSNSERRNKGVVRVKVKPLLREESPINVLDELDNALSQTIKRKLESSMLIGDGRKRDIIVDFKDVSFFEQLGSGTFGEVFRGTCRTQRSLTCGRVTESSLTEEDESGTVVVPVAIKQLLKQPSGEKDKRTQNFLRQFEVWCALDHPNLIFLYGCVLTPQLLLVMEYAERDSLLDVMRERKHTILWERALTWVREIAEGVHYLHSHAPPIYHRDLKPSNVLVTEQWKLKIADFDTARLFTEENLQTFQGKVVGSPAYMAPEVRLALFPRTLLTHVPQMFTGGDFTSKSDVFSIAIMLNELATRIVSGKHVIPYSKREITNLPGGMGVLIFVSGSKAGRPVVHERCPALYREMVEACWHADASQRPSCMDILNMLKPMAQQLATDRSKWFEKLPSTRAKQQK